MGGVDLCDQMKVTYEVDCWSKFRFYLRMFFDFFGIANVNSKILFHKIDSTPALSTISFRYSIAQKRAQEKSNTNFQTNEAIDWRIIWYC